MVSPPRGLNAGRVLSVDSSLLSLVLLFRSLKEEKRWPYIVGFALFSALAAATARYVA